MTETNGNNPFSRFMDDYFAEVDEHLGIIRSKLISLETRIQNHEAADLDSLNELLRCFHTVKGLSGMVALAPAEDLAHHTETCLRQLSLGEMPLTQEVLGALVQATECWKGSLWPAVGKRPCPPLRRRWNVSKTSTLSSRVQLRIRKLPLPAQNGIFRPRINRSGVFSFPLPRTFPKRASMSIAFAEGLKKSAPFCKSPPR